MLDEAEECLAAENDMVEKRQAERVGGAFKPVRDFTVLGAGLQPPRGMVVGHHYRAGPVGQRVGKNLARMDDRRPPMISTIY